MHKKYENWKENEYEQQCYITISIPVKYKVREKYLLYTDDFGNEYFEKDYDYDSLEKAKEQNPNIEKIIKFANENGWRVEEQQLG